MKKPSTPILLILLLILSSPLFAKPEFVNSKNVVEKLNNSPTKSIQGQFLLQVKSINKNAQFLILNSEKKNSLKGNVQVKIPPFVQSLIQQQNPSQPLSMMYQNQTLVVQGQLKKLADEKGGHVTLLITAPGNIAHYQ